MVSLAVPFAYTPTRCVVMSTQVDPAWPLLPPPPPPFFSPVALLAFGPISEGNLQPHDSEVLHPVVVDVSNLH